MAPIKKYIMALDQGTTSSRALIFDANFRILASAQREVTCFYPRSGYVEQDPQEIYDSQYQVMTEVLKKSGILPEELSGIGIANQRETTILWEKDTGQPICNAIVWQCRRTAPLCERLKKEGLEPYIQEATGLRIDAYFSATKIQWILDHTEGARARAEKGEILFGTVDTWLLWKLTGGKVHATDYTNASRTMLFNLSALEWDEKILEHLKIPAKILPEVYPSSHVFGYVPFGNVEIPVAGMAGDQQAAFFGQGCFEKGQAKNTYGTGCFLLMNTGEERVRSRHGLLTTIGIALPGEVRYALEGSVFVGGAVVQWLRDELGLIRDAKESGEIASTVEDTGGVYLVPAFTGLGAPYWDMYARGAIVGLTRGTSRAHLIRAAVESIAYQSKDVLDAMLEDVQTPLFELRADGGACRDRFLMQFQADILGIPLRLPQMQECTALGAAGLAGLAVGVWQSKEELFKGQTHSEIFYPMLSEEQRSRRIHGWNKAVGKSMHWEEDSETIE